MRADGFVGQLVRALARQTPAFRPAAPGATGSAGRQLVTALGRSGPAFSRRSAPDAARQPGSTASARSRLRVMLDLHRWWPTTIGAPARGDLDAFIPRADRRDPDAAARLADLLGARGDIDALTTRADQGDRYAAALLAILLAERGDIDALTTRANQGDPDAALWLSILLRVFGRHGILTTRAERRDARAARHRREARTQAAERLVKHGLIDDLTGSGEIRHVVATFSQSYDADDERDDERAARRFAQLRADRDPDAR